MLVIAGYLLLLIAYIGFCMSSRTVELVSYTREFNKNYVKLNTIDLINNTERSVLNGSVIYSRDIENVNLKIKVVAVERRTSKKWKLFIADLDVCKFLDNGGQKAINMVNGVVKDMKKFGNFIPQSCPLAKDMEYSLLNFYVNETLYPARFPDIDVDLTIDARHGTVRFYYGNLKLSIQTKSKKN